MVARESERVVLFLHFKTFRNLTTKYVGDCSRELKPAKGPSCCLYLLQSFTIFRFLKSMRLTNFVRKTFVFCHLLTIALFAGAGVQTMEI